MVIEKVLGKVITAMVESVLSVILKIMNYWTGNFICGMVA